MSIIVAIILILFLIGLLIELAPLLFPLAVITLIAYGIYRLNRKT